MIMKPSCLNAIFIISVMLAGGASNTTLAATSSTANPIELTMMTLPSELTNREIEAFEKDNPDIHIKLVELSPRLMELGIASGDLPDVFRVEARQMSALVRDRLVLDITNEMTKSRRIAFDDLAKAANYYVFDGRYYGLPKDWSLDLSLYVYTKAFKEAGLPIPSTTEPMTYAELADLAGKLTQRTGYKVTRAGYYTYSIESDIRSILMQRGSTLFNQDSTEMRLTNNPIALEVMRYFYDLSLDGRLGLTPESPDAVNTFRAGGLPIVQYGYWMGAAVSPGQPVYGQVVMLPAPTWDRRLPRINMTIGPIGLAVSATTKHPQEAYRFFEWYTVGKGAELRARTGWGVPTLLSMQSLLPQKTPLDRQRFDVLQSELPYSNWRLAPHPYRSISTTFNQSWVSNLELARAGKIDFAKFASNIQEEVNLAILNELRGSGKRP
jgi:multiple sugar transport system substrate-binding protein